MKNKPIQYKIPSPESLPRLLEEPVVAYQTDSLIFSADAFQKLSGLLGFSQIEWANILHISDRTLQRNLKDAKPFTGLQAELLQYLQKLTSTGLQLFDTAESFVKWLRTPKNVLGKELGFPSLSSITGIGLLQQELGRIAYGVYI